MNHAACTPSQNSPRTKKGSSVFSRSSTTTTSPGKSFLTENSSLGSEADGLCMMLRSFSLRNGSADTVTLFILHSVSWLWPSSPFRPRTVVIWLARRSHSSPTSRSAGVGSMFRLAISVAPFSPLSPLSPSSRFLLPTCLSLSAQRWREMRCTSGLSQCRKQAPPVSCL